MDTKATFGFIEVPTSGSVAILERNSLRHWFVDNMEAAEKAIGDGLDIRVKKPQRGMAERNKGRKMSVCLESTFACNLRCKYCFMSDDPNYEKCAKHMDLSTAKQYLLKYANPKNVNWIRLGFLGGEPTLNMDMICLLVDWCKKNYKKATFSMTTNGTRLNKTLGDATTFKLNPKLTDKTIGEYLAAHNFGITLSFDGPKEIHDACRVTGGGKGSFDDLMASLESLRKTNPRWLRRFTFRCTYCDATIDENNTLLYRLKFFNDLIDKGYGGNAHLEPDALKPETLKHVAKQHYEATEWIISEVKAGRNPRWSEVITRALKQIYYGQPKMRSCGAGNSYLTCGVDGTIYACHRTFGAEIGSMACGIDTELAAEWEDNRVYAVPDCKDCDIKYVCGGACRAANYAEHGTTMIPSTTNCFVRKLRVACALRMIEALTPEEIERVCPNRKKAQRENKNPGRYSYDNRRNES